MTHFNRSIRKPGGFRGGLEYSLWYHFMTPAFVRRTQKIFFFYVLFLRQFSSRAEIFSLNRVFVVFCAILENQFGQLEQKRQNFWKFLKCCPLEKILDSPLPLQECQKDLKKSTSPISKPFVSQQNVNF